MAFEPRNKYKEMSDRELLVLISTGNEMAAYEFYERHKRFILGVCHRHYSATLAKQHGIVEDAEDLRQATFINAFRFATTFKGETARPWLCAIARRAFLDVWEKDEKNRNVLFHFESDRELDNEHYQSPEGDFIHRSDSTLSAATPLSRKIELAIEAVENCKDENDIKRVLNSIPDTEVSSDLLVRLVMEAIEKVLSPKEQLLMYNVFDWDNELPGWLKQKLANLLGIKEVSLFNKEKRAIKKILKYVQSQGDSQDEGKDGQ